MNQRPRSRRSTVGGLGSFGRAAAGTIALVVVAFGASARSHLSLRLERSWVSDRFSDAGVAVFAVVAIACVGALAYSLVRTARHRRDSGEHQQVPEPSHSALLRFVVLVLVLAVLVAPLVFAFVALHGGAPAPTPQVGVRRQPPHPVTGPAAPVNSGASPAIIAAVVIVVVCVVVAALVWWRNGAARRGADAVDAVKPTREPPEDKGLFRQAAREGAVAMRDIADPREAIIACYNAMRRSLAHAGVVEKRSDTPTQLLERAADAGVSPDAARRLTALFLEARFSRHPMDDGKRLDALGALADISDLAARR